MAVQASQRGLTKVRPYKWTVTNVASEFVVQLHGLALRTRGAALGAVFPRTLILATGRADGMIGAGESRKGACVSHFCGVHIAVSLQRVILAP